MKARRTSFNTDRTTPRWRHQVAQADRATVFLRDSDGRDDGQMHVLREQGRWYLDVMAMIEQDQAR